MKEFLRSFSSLPLNEAFKKGCFQLQQKYVQEVLVNCLFKLAQKKCG